MITGLHHLNFIVRNLEETKPAFEALLGVVSQSVEYLPERGVKLVRFRLGKVWLILVEPTDPDGAPGRYLEEHGEGFFLASLAVEDLQAAVSKLTRLNLRPSDAAPRQGLDGWRVVDLDSAAFKGIQLQLVQDSSGLAEPTHQQPGRVK